MSIATGTTATSIPRHGTAPVYIYRGARHEPQRGATATANTTSLIYRGTRYVKQIEAHAARRPRAMIWRGVAYTC